MIKLTPNGQEAARYSGLLLPAAPGWVAVLARWQHRAVTSASLVFEPGDSLFEYFSVVEPMNAFALYSSTGLFKGWYANVSCPAILQQDTLWWRDLYIDVVSSASGEITVLDEAELEAARIKEQDPEAYACILGARDQLLQALRARVYPFDQHPLAPERQSNEYNQEHKGTVGEQG